MNRVRHGIPYQPLSGFLKEKVMWDKAYGNTHLYHPVVTKEEYSKRQLFRLLDGYFNSSFPALASFFAREKDLSMSELEELIKDTKTEMGKKKKKKEQ